MNLFSPTTCIDCKKPFQANEYTGLESAVRCEACLMTKRVLGKSDMTPPKPESEVSVPMKSFYSIYDDAHGAAIKDSHAAGIDAVVLAALQQAGYADTIGHRNQEIIRLQQKLAKQKEVIEKLTKALESISSTEDYDGNQPFLILRRASRTAKEALCAAKEIA